jgi:hypothetical protein
MTENDENPNNLNFSVFIMNVDGTSAPELFYFHFDIV